MQKLTRLFSTANKAGKYYLDNKLQNEILNIPKDEVGSLAKISNFFMEENINLTYIKSMPDYWNNDNGNKMFDITFEKKDKNRIEALKKKL